MGESKHVKSPKGLAAWRAFVVSFQAALAAAAAGESFNSARKIDEEAARRDASE